MSSAQWLILPSEADLSSLISMARLDDLGKKPGLTPRALISLAVVKLMKAPDLMASLHPEERVQRVLRVAQGLPANPPQQVSPAVYLNVSLGFGRSSAKGSKGLLTRRVLSPALGYAPSSNLASFISYSSQSSRRTRPSTVEIGRWARFTSPR